jgi:crotonobetainyl-CoA:carnitine CoA-transferase CaiB-like acyl-CoA transferase
MGHALDGVPINHHKRSITLDTRSAHGKQVLERLVQYCDVLGAASPERPSP